MNSSARGLLGRPSIGLFCPPAPEGDRVFHAENDDGVVRQVEQRRLAPQGVFRPGVLVFMIEERLRCRVESVQRLIDFRHSRGRKGHRLASLQRSRSALQRFDRSGNPSCRPGGKQHARQRHCQAHEACDENGLPDRRCEHVILRGNTDRPAAQGRYRIGVCHLTFRPGEFKHSLPLHDRPPTCRGGLADKAVRIVGSHDEIALAIDHRR